MSALFTLRVAVPGILDPPGSTAGREGPAPTHAGDARSSRRPDDDDDDRVDDERGAGVPRWETLEFRAGNPRAEVITGRLRLYRDAVCASVASASSSSSAATTTTSDGDKRASLVTRGQVADGLRARRANRTVRRRLLPVRRGAHTQGDGDAHGAGSAEGDTNRRERGRHTRGTDGETQGKKKSRRCVGRNFFFCLRRPPPVSRTR